VGLSLVASGSTVARLDVVDYAIVYYSDEACIPPNV